MSERYHFELVHPYHGREEVREDRDEEDSANDAHYHDAGTPWDVEEEGYEGERGRDVAPADGVERRPTRPKRRHHRPAPEHSPQNAIDRQGQGYQHD